MRISPSPCEWCDKSDTDCPEEGCEKKQEWFKAAWKALREALKAPESQE